MDSKKISLARRAILQEREQQVQNSENPVSAEGTDMKGNSKRMLSDSILVALLESNPSLAENVLLSFMLRDESILFGGSGDNLISDDLDSGVSRRDRAREQGKRPKDPLQNKRSIVCQKQRQASVSSSEFSANNHSVETIMETEHCTRSR